MIIRCFSVAIEIFCLFNVILDIFKILSSKGYISRQEAVSMIPPLLLSAQPHHKVPCIIRKAALGRGCLCGGCCFAETLLSNEFLFSVTLDKVERDIFPFRFFFAFLSCLIFINHLTIFFPFTVCFLICLLTIQIIISGLNRLNQMENYSEHVLRGCHSHALFCIVFMN